MKWKNELCLSGLPERGNAWLIDLFLYPTGIPTRPKNIYGQAAGATIVVVIFAYHALVIVFDSLWHKQGTQDSARDESRRKQKKTKKIKIATSLK